MPGLRRNAGSPLMPGQALPFDARQKEAKTWQRRSPFAIPLCSGAAKEQDYHADLFFRSGCAVPHSTGAAAVPPTVPDFACIRFAVHSIVSVLSVVR